VNRPIIICIIPARAGSKGVPRKNLMKLKGHPLIAYSIKASHRSGLIDRTVISTDSEEIARVAKQYGAEVPFLRPVEIAQDFSPDYEFVAHALHWLSTNEGAVPDYIVHLRPTTPLRDVSILDDAIRLILGRPESTALRSVHEMQESAYKCFEIEGGILKRVGNGSYELDASNFARQQFSKTYSANGYVDVLKSSFVLQEKRIHGSRVVAYVTPSVVEVDSLEQFTLLEYQLSKDPRIFDALFL